MTSIKVPKTKKGLGLRLIGILKLFSATLLLTLAFGIFHMLDKELGSVLEHYVRRLHLDTDHKWITQLLAKASGVSARQLIQAGTVTLIYSMLYAIEGIGLLMMKQWAEYLTVIVTGLLIPLEIYEVIRKPSSPRIIVLIVNVVIVVYLIYRLRTDKAGN